MREDQTKQAMNQIGASIGYASDNAQQACGYRQSAKGLLRDRIERLRREATELEALLRALPEELPPTADSALWALAINQR